jgi:hypothetical protein
MESTMSWLAIGLGIAAAVLFAFVIVLALTPISDHKDDDE